MNSLTLRNRIKAYVAPYTDAVLDTSKIDFSTPQNNTPTGSKPYNTILSTISLEGSSAKILIYYNRINIASVLTTKPIDFTITNETYLRQILSKINICYNLSLTTDDIIDVPIPATSSKRIIRIATKADSYFYIGSYQLNLNKSKLPPPVVDPDNPTDPGLPPSQVDLSSIITLNDGIIAGNYFQELVK